MPGLLPGMIVYGVRLKTFLPGPSSLRFALDEWAAQRR